MSNLALVKKDTVDVVASKVREFHERGELLFPADYSPENAMKSAWLALQSTVDRNNKPALEVCTRDSIANALLDMVVQGLTPAKKQCYFIIRGTKLCLDPSYFGLEAILKRVTDAEEIYAQVVYEGDELEYEIQRGRYVITKHKQKLENINKANIIAAYCSIYFKNGREYTELMTADQIKQAWKQSPNYKEDGNGVHQKFTEEMSKKTVIRRSCKAFINSSDDSSLVKKSYQRQSNLADEAAVESEISENANKQPIDITAEASAMDEGQQQPDTEQPESQETAQDVQPDAFEQAMRDFEQREAVAAGASPDF